MMVRLAFAVMVQADADIMLIDEVLAVGDAAFAQKCMDVFHERRRKGRTVVLVTHDMATVQSLCHRALLIDEGELRYVGEPEDAALAYYRTNFTGSPTEHTREDGATVDLNTRVVHAGLRNPDGEPVENVEEGWPIVLDVVLEAARDLQRPSFVMQLRNANGVLVFQLERELAEDVPAGRRVRLAGTIENRLAPGRFSLDCWVRREGDHSGLAVQGLRLLHFVVYGAASQPGVVTLRTDVEPVVEEGTG
jgi:ABC-2 type transport system ATP-binding protein